MKLLRLLPILAVLVLTGCGSTAIQSSTATTPQQEAETEVANQQREKERRADRANLEINEAASQYSSPCTLYVVGHHVILQFQGSNAPKDCAAWLYNNKHGGEKEWTTESQQGAWLTNEKACVLTSPTGLVIATVADTGARELGSAACHQLTNSGWTEEAKTETTQSPSP